MQTDIWTDGQPDNQMECLMDRHMDSHMHVSNALRAQYILLLFVVNFP